jgi:holliday junction DNA helicase RuvA
LPAQRPEFDRDLREAPVLIGRLTGTVASEEADGTFVLDVGGVGYEVLAPVGALGRARGQATGGELTFYVHTHVREDALSLFGFATPEDKAAFRTLISVSNVGPKMALALLSAMPAEELARAVGAKDLTKLVAVPGIGKKTAERLLLELKDKIAPPARPAAGVRREQVAEGAGPTNAELLTSALTRMGYRPAEADRAVLHLGGRIDTEPVQVLVREALAVLAR